MWLKHAKKPIVAVAPILDGSAASFLEACKEAGIASLDITLEHAVAAAALRRLENPNNWLRSLEWEDHRNLICSFHELRLEIKCF
jgi:2-keto-3-deoxy-6-phosphogluconate aldolase